MLHGTFWVGGGGGREGVESYTAALPLAISPVGTLGLYVRVQDLYNDDVGNAALFLSSEMSRVMTGLTM